MIVGFTGKMGAGKNEAAKRLALLSPERVVEVSFAAKLKQSAAVLLGCSVEDLERWKNDPDTFVLVRTPTGEAYPPERIVRQQTVRSFLQRYGTEAHRDVFGSDFWVDQALPFPGYPQSVQYEDALYVVTDCRFPNEAQRIRDLGGKIVRLVGPNEATGDHPSEQQDLEADHFIENSVRDDGFRWLDAQLERLLVVVGVHP